MAIALRKWKALYGVYAQDWLAYKANGLIWILTDLFTAIIMPLVWASAARSGLIDGFDAAAFTAYYLAMIMVGSFVTSHLMWEIGMEIREGVFTTHLTRPISFFQSSFIRNFAWRSIRCLMSIPFLLGLVWAYWSVLNGVDLYLGWEFWTAVILGHLVSFTIVIAMSMIALFVQEATTIFELYYVPQLFLSGYLFPVSVLPEWAQNTAAALPFYYTTGLPVDILVGKRQPDTVGPLLGIQICWIVVAVLAGKILWARGLRHYTGAGM